MIASMGQNSFTVSMMSESLKAKRQNSYHAHDNHFSDLSIGDCPGTSWSNETRRRPIRKCSTPLYAVQTYMLWITNISWDPTRQQIPNEQEFEKENLLETKKEEGESVVILKFGRLKQEDNSSCHKNLGDLEEVWLSILNVVTAIAIVTKFKSHPSHLWKTDFHSNRRDREISHGNLFFLNSQIRYTMKLNYATALIILSQYSNHCVNYFN